MLHISTRHCAEAVPLVPTNRSRLIGSLIIPDSRRPQLPVVYNCQQRCSTRCNTNSSVSCVSRARTARQTVTRAASVMAAAAQSYASNNGLLQPLVSYVAAEADRASNLSSADMVLLFSALQAATKRIAFAVSQASVQQLGGYAAGEVSQDRDAPKQLDVVANEILKEALRSTGLVAVMASEEDDEPIVLEGGQYVVVFDPLDGSRNIECSIPTGTIFGIYAAPAGRPSADAALQPGAQLLASGYALYSSATMMVISLGGGRTAGFTLDATAGEFVATHPDLRLPARGQIYSVNDARYFDWPQGLRSYIDTIRQGKGQNPKQYSARYVCSLVADLHRTLLYGGVCMNPRSHLRLVYEANPLAFLTENAGGKGSNGKHRILNIQPEAVHQRLPLFLGSPQDIAELESYGDVQQVQNPGYTV